MFVHVTPTVMDGIVVRWNPDTTGNSEISASRNGVHVHCWPMLRVEHDRVEFDRTVSLAWEMYRLLAKAAERGPFVRMESDEVTAWLAAHAQQIVDVRFGETLADAVARQEAPTTTEPF